MGFDMYREGDGPDGHEGYYRLNVWGMSEAVPKLANFGIVRPAAMPRVPHGEDFGVTEYFDEDDHMLTSPQMAYKRAIMLWRDGTHGEGPGIPSYKFGSNDGWLVLPIEIQSGVLFATEHCPNWRNEIDDWVLAFVVWMEGCADGFRVY